MTKYLSFTTCLITICLIQPALAAINATINPTHLTMGQSAQLIFSSDKPFTRQPDLSALTKNFEIAGAQNRFAQSIINGRQTTQYELIFNVFPLKSGQLTIPSLKIENETTNPIQLTVSEQTTPTKNTPDISFSATTDTTTLYEGESLLYTTTLTERVGILSAQIKAPTLNNATIEQFSNDTASVSYSYPKPARILKRTYLITPQQTGQQTIQPARFVGQLAPELDATNPFAAFSQMPVLFGGVSSFGQDTILTTKPQPITVLPKPQNYTANWWLPARALSLSTLNTLPDTGVQGEPVTIVLELIAIGTDSDKLPTLTLPDNPHFKIYTTPAKRQNFIDGENRFAGRLAQEINLIPLHAGRFELPLPTVDWFNTTTRQQQSANLPPHLIEIKSSALLPTTTQQPSPPKTQSLPARAQPISPPQPFLNTDQILKWGSTFSFFLLALTGFVFALRPLFKKHKTKKRLPDLYPY